MSDHDSHEADGAPHTMVEWRDMNEALNAMDGDRNAERNIAESASRRAEREREARRRTRMAVEAARREAYARAALSRSGERLKEPVLEVVGTSKDDDKTYAANIRLPGKSETVPLGEALGVDGVEIVLGEGERTRDRVVLSTYPDTPAKYLELVRQLLTVRAERWEAKDRSPDEKAIVASEEARQALHATYGRMARDAETPFEKKKVQVLAAEAAYLKTLKSAHHAFLHGLQHSSEYFHEHHGVHLETALGMREHEAERYLDSWLQAESLKVISPWEKTPAGYKNRATGGIDDPANPAVMWWMYKSTRDIWQDGMVMERLRKELADDPKARALQHARDSAWWMKKEVGLVMKAGLLTGAGVGLLFRTLWRTFGEVPFYYLDRWASSVKDDLHEAGHWLQHDKPGAGNILGAFGGLFSWVGPSDKEKPAPWKERGDPPVLGPLNRLRKAAAQGLRWQGDKPSKGGGHGGGGHGGGGHH